MNYLDRLHHLVPWGGTGPQLLFEEGDHRIYWLGMGSATAFRCNTYMVVGGGEALLVDPGGRDTFQEIRRRVAELIALDQLKGLILSHQDPDVAASMHQWLQLIPELLIFTTPRTNVLLPSYCNNDYRAFDVEEHPRYRLPSGRWLRFIPSPFLHFPGAFATYDETSGFLFSGDVWAALDMGGPLVVRDLTNHRPRMDLFMKDYMANNVAARGFLRAIAPLEIRAILPQHGSIIPEGLVEEAKEYLARLECGLDLIYPGHPLPEEGWRFPGEGHPLPEEEMVGIAQEVKSCQEECQVRRRSPERCNNIMRDALLQALRLGAMRDQALRELKAAEHRLRRSRELLAEAQALAHLGHWELDLESGRIDWSPEIYRIFGVSPGRFQPSYEALLRACHRDDRYRVQLAVRRAVNEGEPYELIHRVVRPDGSLRTVQQRGRIVAGDNGGPRRLIGTILDITPLARAEEELMAQKNLIEAIQRMQAVFIASPSPVKVCRQLLDDLLALTRSEHGFVGEVHHDPDGKPYIILYALTDASWDEESRLLYRQAEAKGMEFHNLDNLFGRCVTARRPVIANAPHRHPDSRGTPKGHLPLDSFCGIPVFFGERVVGLIGLANRPGGYDQALLDYLQPLLGAFGQVIVAGQDFRARREMEKVLIQQAKLDGLLGIPNRRHLDEYLEQQLRVCSRTGQYLSVIMVDVDHFKLYNDHYGHQKGDWCLKQVARVIQESLKRPMDMVGRYGGEEFLCVLPDTDMEGALEVARRIEKRLEQEALPHHYSPVCSRVTVSMGVASREPGSDLTARELVSMADHCLYEAKSSGRNSVVAASLEG